MTDADASFLFSWYLWLVGMPCGLLGLLFLVIGVVSVVQWRADK